ncbi:MAG: transglutaminase family protein [Pseudomonadales bacterium]|nr:transglutaminase family protein [Pseudomonadales bacterium]NRA17124.1 transglutaminase family protein [Oceanospirillaceae bacterium]
MHKFLESSEYIDWHHPLVVAWAQQLSADLSCKTQIAEKCFYFVRDQIKHSWDYRLNPVTCKASDVLAQGTGYCYAKSHLLAALLRANSIPTGLCYQRLTISDEQPPFCLHGLNAIYLEDFGWYRADARGNKPGVTAEFCPPQEQLAFNIVESGEKDLPEIWSEPLKVVIDALTYNQDYQQVADNLPDVRLLDL